jgi:lipopolysaccharide export LptBFGC system permease protein LptF
MGLVVGLTLVMVIWLAAGWQGQPGLEQRDAATRVVSEFHPRIITAVTVLFVAIAALILWYRLPVESMQKAILIGFVPYLIYSYMVLELLTANLWPKGGWLATVNTWAWPLLLGYWARSAWQPFREIIPRGRPPLAVIQGSAG